MVKEITFSITLVLSKTITVYSPQYSTDATTFDALPLC